MKNWNSLENRTTRRTRLITCGATLAVGTKAFVPYTPDYIFYRNEPGPDDDN